MLRKEYVDAVREAAGDAVADSVVAHNTNLATPDSAPQSIGWDVERWDAMATVAGVRSGRVFMGMIFEHGEDVAAALISELRTACETGAGEGFPLYEQLDALRRLGRWLLKDGKVDWNIRTVLDQAREDKTRLSVMAPRAIARDVKVSAARSGQSISEYVLGFLPEAATTSPRA